MIAELKPVEAVPSTHPSDDADQASEQTSSSDNRVVPGERLRAAREAAGMTQEEVAAELRLDLKLIRALEEGDLEHLHEPVFTAGYLRSYARLMGLPADELVAQYVKTETRAMPPLNPYSGVAAEQHGKDSHVLQNSFSTADRSHRRAPSGLRTVLTVLLVLVVAGFAVVGARLWLSHSISVPFFNRGEPARHTDQNRNPNSLAIPAQPPDANVEQGGEAVQPQSAPADNPKGTRKGKTIRKSLPLNPLPGASLTPKNKIASQTAPSAEDLTRLSLRFSDTSWVDIRDATGKRLIRELGLKGATKHIAGVAPFSVLLGYGPGVEIAYNGKTFDFSRFQGDRIARFSLLIKDDQLKAKRNKTSGMLLYDESNKAPLPEPED